MEECWRQVNGCSLPESFKLKLVNSLLRQMIEVSALQKGIEEESGFEADTASYLSILLAKEESDLMRRVSHCRCLKQVSVGTCLGWVVRCSSRVPFLFSLVLVSLNFSLSLSLFTRVSLSPQSVSCYLRASSSVPCLPTRTIWRPPTPCGTLPCILFVCVSVCASPSIKPPHFSIGKATAAVLWWRRVRRFNLIWMDGRSPEFRSLAFVCRVHTTTAVSSIRTIALGWKNKNTPSTQQMPDLWMRQLVGYVVPQS